MCRLFHFGPQYIIGWPDLFANGAYLEEITGNALNTFRFFDGDETLRYISGTYTATPRSVPEPGTLALMLGGLFAIAARCRTRMRGTVCA